MTEPEPLQQLDRTYVRFRGRKLSYFSGCDYFRLASHPAVLKAARDGVTNYGLNVAASRLTTGNHPLYRILETRLAKFFRAEDALLVPTGYMTNLIAAQGLAGRFSHALLDERAHPALQDAAGLLNCPVLRFRHRDPANLEQTLRRCGKAPRPLVLTDGLFSHDGTIAPLAAYLKVLPRNGWVLVDDAHGAGIVGPTGRGTVEAERTGRSRVIQCVTLSKAFGVYGGAILATRAVRKTILARSRLYVGCTPLPLPLAHAAVKAIELVQADGRLLERLLRNVAHVKSALRAAGIALPDAPGPIVPVHFSDDRATAALRRRLLAAGIYPPFVKYPGAPANGYFRFVISSEHSRKQLDDLVSVLKHA